MTLFRPLFLGLSLLGLALLSACAQPTPILQIETAVIAQNLEVPWSLAFAPDGRLFFTERPGRLKVIENGRVETVAKLEVAAVGEGGLLGLALDPDFSRQPYFYVYYTYQSGGRLWNRVARFLS